MLPHFFAHIPADSRDNERNGNANAQIGGKGDAPQRDVEGSDEDAHHRFHCQRDADRRDRVGVEHLKKFHIRGDQGDQIALVPALQSGGAQPSKRAENAVAHDSQDPEGDVVVQTLLREAKDRARKGQRGQEDPDRSRLDLCIQPEPVQDRASAQNRDELYGKESQRARQHGQDHVARKRLYKAEHPEQRNDPGATLGSILFTHALPPPFRSCLYFRSYPYSRSGRCPRSCRYSRSGRCPRSCRSRR